jgi:hypothetical protein
MSEQYHALLLQIDGWIPDLIREADIPSEEVTFRQIASTLHRTEASLDASADGSD